jgi:hypothetical protein
MSLGLLEVETESAGRYENVDRETLHRLVSQLGLKNSYLILLREEKPDEFAQVAIEIGKTTKAQDSFVVEFKDRSGAQFQSKTTDIDQVVLVLAGWGFDIPGWKNVLKWKRLKLNKVVNLRANCTFTLNNGVWTAHFPFLGLSASGPDEDEAYRELQTVIAETVNQGPEELRATFAKFLEKNLIDIPQEELNLKLEREKLSEEQQIRIAKSSGRWWPNEESDEKTQ